MLFNINDYVRVKLTDHGRDVHYRNHMRMLEGHTLKVQRSMPYRAPKEDDNGWSEWQLWRLMQEFGGNETGMGRAILFDAEIEIILPKTKIDSASGP